jgi:GrpB-like predicted nucleotidyltransferase (UPF0157 family)
MDDIELVAYDPDWPERYQREASRLRHALDPSLILGMEHIGSTAIPGMSAKPIIDILIMVRSLSLAQQLAVAPIVALGYLFWETNPKPDRMFFVKGLPPLGTGRTHHVHLAEPESEPTASIPFRDYLRSHDEASRRYAQLKQELASTYRSDREGYTAAKSTFVQEILRLSRPL